MPVKNRNRSRRPRGREILPPATVNPAALVSRLLRGGEARLPLLPQRRLRALDDAAASQAAIRALATAIPLPQPDAAALVLCRVLGRFKLLVAAEDLAHAPHLMLDGYWKWWMTAFLSRNLRPGQRVVDAGAGYGYFTLLAGEMVGPAGRVLAIEAHPLLAGLARRSLALNGMAERAEVRHGALGADAAEEATCGLVVPPGSPTASRLAVAEEPAPEEAPDDTLEVPCLPGLDALLPEGADWIKLDLNGAEPAAWDGMQGLLDRCPDLGVILPFVPARLPDAAAWLGRMAARVPLRRIGADGTARPVGVEEVLREAESTLCLMRGAPR